MPMLNHKTDRPRHRERPASAIAKYGLVQSDEFKDAKEVFEDSIRDPQYRRWVNEALVASAFYDGQQLSEMDKAGMLDAGQAPVIVNLIKTRIDNITGMEIKTRTKNRYRSRSGKENEVQTANALTDLAYYHHDKERTLHKLSRVGLFSRITGLGWHEFDMSDAGRIEEGIGDPFEYIWDLADKTPDMSNQRLMFRYRWLDVEEACEMFPKHKEYLRSLAKQAYRQTQKDFNRGLIDFDFGYGHPAQPLFNGAYNNSDDSKICVVEKQYRKRANVWTAITEDGKVIRTFDRKEAEKLAKNKREGDGVRMDKGWQVMSLFFTADTELWKGPLEQQLDMTRGEFLYTPFVYNRELISGVPYGAVRAAVDPQRMYNKKASKLLWLMSSRQIIAETSAVDDWDDVTDQAAKPDGVIVLKEGGMQNFKFERNQPEITTHFQSMQEHKKEIEEALGIYNESLGVQTNAQSGLAIQKRQDATITTHVLPMDNFREMKVKHGRKLLQLMRAGYTEQIAFWVTDDQQVVREMSLNEPLIDPRTNKPLKDAKGNPIIVNDVRVGDFDLYLEEIPDFATQREESFQRLLEVAKSGLPVTPGWLELAGVPNTSKLMTELNAGQNSGNTGGQDAPGQPGAPNNSPAVPGGGSNVVPMQRPGGAVGAA